MVRGPAERRPSASDFEPYRRPLVGLAYRMLGSVAEAEDVVQEAYLRWHGVDRTAVADPRAYLSRVVARLCLDHIRSARARREEYVGPWLPEPVLGEPPAGPDAERDLADDLSIGLMLALERLSPLERAAFLLHDVFDVEFSEVAEALGRSEAACRQLAARARRNLRTERPRFAVAREEGVRLAEAFLAASRSGDVTALRALLAEDVVMLTDGGGVRIAALTPITGAERVVRFFASIAEKADRAPAQVVHRGPVNGLPGFVTLERDGLLQTIALDIVEGRIAAIYVVRNPEKLAHLSGLDPSRVPSASPPTAESP